jgi:hypothetical protein
MEMERYSKSPRDAGSRIARVATLALLVAASACGARTVPSSIELTRVRPADTTSILKKLTVQITIGSTVDSENGDEGPRAIAIVPHSKLKSKLTKGQLLVCNFENAAGVPGEGTTIEVLDPASSSQPRQFVQSAAIEGCDGDAINSAGYVFAAGLTSAQLVEFSAKGAHIRTYRRRPIAAPFSDVVASGQQQFSPEYVFVGTTYGGIASISSGFYGNGDALQVAKGFATSDSSEGGEMAPSGLQYNKNSDVLYIIDGVTNTIVAFANASELLDHNEIVVEPGGMTFECEYSSITCASLVYSGSPLDAPLAAALLPNGNLIVANTQGTANMLIELTPQGQVLDTKVVDSSATQGVFGLAAAGTNDDNTVLFFTDTNSNTVQELEQ